MSLLYGNDSSIGVDECRYNLFVSGKCSDEALPPNSDCLLQHIRRSNFQAISWKQCLSPLLQLPQVEGNGWKLDGEGRLEISWMTNPSAPESLIEFVKCSCKTGCKSKRCSCVKSNVQCTEVCSCNGCGNMLPVDDDEESEDESEDDDLDCQVYDDESIFND